MRRQCTTRRRFPAPRLDRALSEPRLLGQPLRLERADLVGVLQREADVVEAVQQAMLAERLDVEARTQAQPSGVATVCCSRSIVSREARERRDVGEQPVDLGSGSTIGSRPFL